MLQKDYNQSARTNGAIGKNNMYNKKSYGF